MADIALKHAIYLSNLSGAERLKRKGEAPKLRVLIGSIASRFGANSGIDKISISISSIVLETSAHRDQLQKQTV